MTPGCCFCGWGNRRKNGNHPPIAEESSFPIEATVNKEQEIKEETAIPIEANISAEKEIIEESDFPIEAAASREKGVRTFSYAELAKAARSFTLDDNNRLGHGLTGEVFKGELSNGEVVAIKRLKHQANPEHEEMARHQYQVEAEILSRIEPHQNIVRVIGYCSDKSNRLLVYEFVSNNSLMSCLHGKEKQTIKWSDRLKIALGTAEGLKHLHCKSRIIHRDIKSANILLNDKFIPKIGDFGLAKEFMSFQSHVSTDPKGTPKSYEPPEYYVADQKRKLTKKSDVFSFGVVLLELITGKFAILENKDRLVDWALSPLKQILEIDNKEEDLDTKNYNNFVDFKLQKNYNEKEMSRMIYCAAACIYKPAKLRPKISEIVEVLNGNKEPLDYIWLRNDTQYLHQGSLYDPLPEAPRPREL